jgi:hypothetical protein
MKKILTILVLVLMTVLYFNGCLSSGNNTVKDGSDFAVAKPFGVETMETIKKEYLGKKYLFIEKNTEFSEYEAIDLNNIYTVTDVKMKNIDEETVDYILVFENEEYIREQKYGQLFKNFQNINFFDYEYIIIGDTISIYNNEIEMQYDLRNDNPIEKQKLFYRAYYPVETFMTAYENFKITGVPKYIPPSNHNVNKLIALLVNPMSAGTFGQFSRNEDVRTPKALLRIIDSQRSSDPYVFLVAVNDYNVQKPFYILTNRMPNLMDLDYSNTIFEDLWLKYIGTENYSSNGVQRETFVFQVNSSE